MSFRSARNRFQADEKAWLQPKTLGAAGVCWAQPEVTVVSHVGPTVTVRLVDGREMQIHEDNVTRTQPQPPQPAKPKVAPRPAVLRGGEEVSLW